MVTQRSVQAGSTDGQAVTRHERSNRFVHGLTNYIIGYHQNLAEKAVNLLKSHLGDDIKTPTLYR